MKYRPRKKHTLQKWLEGGAFGELLVSGDRNLLSLFEVYDQHGIESAWLFYCALLFVEDNNIIYACGEAYALYNEAIIIRMGNRRDVDYKPVIFFLNRVKTFQAYSSNLIRYTSLPSTLKERKKRIKWPVDPDFEHVGEIIVTGNFLLLIVSNYMEEHKVDKIPNCDYVAVTQSLRVFYDDVIPWFENLPKNYK